MHIWEFSNIDAQIDKTQISSNQLGYISQGEHMSNTFNPAKMIKIPQIWTISLSRKLCILI